MTDTFTSIPATPAGQRPARRRLLVVLATTTAAALVWVIVEVGFGYDLHAPAMGGSPGMDIGAGAVVISSAVAGMAAWGSLAALERWSPRPRLIWTGLAGVVFLLSLGGPLGGEGIDTAHRAALLALHAVVAVGLIPGMATTTQGVRR